MRKIILACSMLLAMATGNALAANSMNKGTFGLNVNTEDNFIVNGKYFIAKDMAVLGGFGLSIAGGNANGTDIGFLAGVRKYMKTDDFAPFVGGRFEYSSTNDSNFTNLSILVEAGAEYFLAKQFSLEGRVGFGYVSEEIKIPPFFTSKVTRFGTSTVGLSANFYF